MDWFYSYREKELIDKVLFTHEDAVIALNDMNKSFSKRIKKYFFKRVEKYRENNYTKLP